MFGKTFKPINFKIVTTLVLTISVWVTLALRILLYPDGVVGLTIDLGIFLFTLIFGVLVVQSVDKETKQRDELSKLAFELRALDAKKDEFVNMAAHELRAPLTAIKGFLSMVIAGDAGEVTDKTKEFLEDSAVSTQRMIRLVNNMLNVSRIEEGRIIYSMDNFRLSHAVEQILSEFKIEAQQKGLKLEMHVSTHVMDSVFVDKDRIDEVVINFLSNAIKYTESGLVEIKIVNPTPHVVRLEVVDTGPGVSELEQKKLFQKFYRVEAKVGKTIGTGLGLYISKLLIRKFGGEIGVISKENNGSTFWFELPVKSV